MPIITNSQYKPSWPFTGGHFGSMFPTLFRKIPDVSYKRERIKTPDDDFIDLDFLHAASKKLVVLCHGLEGNASSKYMMGMARVFQQAGWNVAAFNFRGCSGEVNRQLRFYHSGATDDLNTVMEYVNKKEFNEIALIGFSLGGNLILKYLGAKEYQIPGEVKGAAVFSVPVDLKDASIELIKKKNWIYTKRFLIKLKNKVRAKRHCFREE